jgi:hypothetical protein
MALMPLTVEDRAEIRRLWRAEKMPVKVIAERIGWERGLTVLKDRVRKLRPAYLAPNPASRTAYGQERGAAADCGLSPRP